MEVDFNQPNQTIHLSGADTRLIIGPNLLIEELVKLNKRARLSVENLEAGILQVVFALNAPDADRLEIARALCRLVENNRQFYAHDKVNAELQALLNRSAFGTGQEDHGG
jgi:hypothetical protein